MPLPTLLVPGNVVSSDPAIRSQVPIDYILGVISAMMTKTSSVNAFQNRVLVIKAKTGSGKSTVMPAKIYERFLMNQPGVIAVTQPRVLTAIDITKNQIAPQYKYLRLGDNLGWTTGPNKKQAKRGLIYSTIGSLQQQLRNMTDAEILDRFRFIIVDEVHEMSVDLAILFISLKSLFTRNAGNAKLPFLILTSATFRHEIFLKYFDLIPQHSNVLGVLGTSGVSSNSRESKSASQDTTDVTRDTFVHPNYIFVEGSSFKREVVYRYENGVPDYIQAAAETAAYIHMQNPGDQPAKADILVFLPGGKEMTDVTVILDKANAECAKNGKPVFKVIAISREEINEETIAYVEAFTVADRLRVIIGDSTYTPQRKIILSTTVAETGLTIDTLKYSVDSGYNRSSEFNPRMNVNGLITRPAALSSIEQRKGRVGRKFDGEFYPLYPRFMMDVLFKDKLSEIAIGDITESILPILVQQTSYSSGEPLTIAQMANTPETVEELLKRRVDINSIDLVDPASNDTLMSCWEKLYNLGFIARYVNAKKQPDDANANDANSANTTLTSALPSGSFWYLTKMGVLASRFTHVKIEALRMIFAGYVWGYSIMDLATMAAAVMANVKLQARDPVVWGRVYSKAFVKWGKPTKAKRGGSELYDESKAKGGDDSPNPSDLTPEEELQFVRTRLLIADDLVDYLLAVMAAMRVVDEAPTDTALSALQEWCEETNIVFPSIVFLLQARSDLIEQMIVAGMDPTLNQDVTCVMSTPETIANDVTRLKQCIFEGYRDNYLTWNGKSNEYHGPRGVRVKVPGMFADSKKSRERYAKYGVRNDTQPRALLYTGLNCKFDTKSKTFILSAQHVSSSNMVVDN